MMESRLLSNILIKSTLGSGDLSALLSLAEKSPSGENLLEAYLITLKKRGASDQEVHYLIKLLLQRAKKLVLGMAFLDVCGTGGDRSNSFNVSTTTAFVLAAAGVPVLKHGNRSVSSQCGSSDLLEGLGISLEKCGAKAKETMRKYRFAYLHAPLFHPFFGKIAPLRRRIGMPTVFNLLGPLLHPASPRLQLVGIGDSEAFKRYAFWLKAAGRQKAIVVHGDGGLDEASPYGITQLYELKNGKVRTSKIRARDFGFKARSLKDLVVSGRAESVNVFKRIISAKEKGPKREAAVLNAGLGFCLAGRAKNLKQGIKMAEETLDSGRAKILVDNFSRATGAKK